MKNNFGTKDIVRIDKGKRVYLHPKLFILDKMDCNVWFDRELRFFYVEYNFIGGVFTKSILTNDTNSLVNDINKFKNHGSN